jgi:5'-nucleotidase
LALIAGGCAAVGQTKEPFHVMLTNDDGIESPGLLAVAEVLARDPSYRVTVVAPAQQQSGVGHAIVIRRDVEVVKHEPLAGCPSWSVDATPASTVLVGLSVLLEDDPPSLVVSGINRGENVGRAAWYSGTVGAAREALLNGIPSIAFSLTLDWENPQPAFKDAAKWTKPLIDMARDQGLPQETLLNVNIPVEAASAKGYRLARMDLSPDEVSRYVQVKQEGESVFYRSQWKPTAHPDTGSDALAVSEGWVSVVPLSLDQTRHSSLAMLEFTLPRQTVITSANVAEQ